jgi:hypothetical protein
MQLYTVYLYLETALHVSGGTSTHHQEGIQLYLQHLLFVTRLQLPAAIAVCSSNLDISACIATRYRLECPGDRIPVWASVSAPVQTRSGARPAFYTMGNGCFPGVKLRRYGTDHPPQSSAEVK